MPLHNQPTIKDSFHTQYINFSSKIHHTKAQHHTQGIWKSKTTYNNKNQYLRRISDPASLKPNTLAQAIEFSRLS